MTPVTAWARAFLLTVLVETPIAVALLREAEPRLARRVPAVLIANLATHPSVWFVFPALGLGDAASTFASEMFAVLVEAALYALLFGDALRARGRSPALACAGVSALANGASYAAGLALYALRGAI